MIEFSKVEITYENCNLELATRKILNKYIEVKGHYWKKVIN